MKYSLPSIIGCSQHRPRKDLETREVKKTISACVLSLVRDFTLEPWLCLPPRHWEFLGNNDRQRYNHTGSNTNENEIWDPPMLRCYYSHQENKTKQNFESGGNSQHGWSLLQAGMKVSSAERKLWGKESSHTSLHSAMTTSQYPPTRMWDPMWVAVTMGRQAVRYGVKV